MTRRTSMRRKTWQRDIEPPIPAVFDEMSDGDGRSRSHCREFERWLGSMPASRIAEKRAEADLLFHRALSPCGRNVRSGAIVP